MHFYDEAQLDEELRRVFDIVTAAAVVLTCATASPGYST